MEAKDKRIDNVIKQNEFINDKMRGLTNQITDLKRKNTMLKNEMEAIVLGIDRIRLALDDKIASNGRAIGKLDSHFNAKMESNEQRPSSAPMTIHIENATINMKS